jgi:hypothetical protein
VRPKRAPFLSSCLSLPAVGHCLYLMSYLLLCDVIFWALAIWFCIFSYLFFFLSLSFFPFPFFSFFSFFFLFLFFFSPHTLRQQATKERPCGYSGPPPTAVDCCAACMPFDVQAYAAENSTRSHLQSRRPGGLPGNRCV